ncbi:carbohydrate ABC transporter permease [Phytohabitans sp. ZYX-F-186]|uniref:Carbohydrate ABC transporter permease n=1 Tax=Phytohabitans maris TaxID=3071409 RepID=A0ABU0ZVY7_9ACTN|nr:carbohydrate ABC transporter permease [Phytohabitans sp. ZYX-F-186]MDQ7911204.1 carbohydrate ABC transporter permease [Phytohabitans sp. ZYX-F-186]
MSRRRTSPAERTRSVSLHVLLTAGALLMVVPFVWMILSSLKDQPQVFVFPPKWLPDPARWGNYAEVWRAAPFLRAYGNSVFIAVMIVALQLVTCAMAAYAFARLRFRGKNLLFLLFLATMMVPGQLTIIPVFLLMANIGLYDTHWAIILPEGLFSAFGVFMLRQFVRGIPLELEDAALIDGASRWRIFWSIIMPLLRAPLAALGTFTFVSSWNNFLAPLVFLRSPENYTVPVLIAQFKGEYSTNLPLLMAAASIAIVPVLVVFVIAQRQIIRGVTLTGAGK